MITNILWPKNKINCAILIYIQERNNQELLLKYNECKSEYILLEHKWHTLINSCVFYGHEVDIWPLYNIFKK